MSSEEKALARRGLIKRLALAGALPAVVAVIAATSPLKAAPPPPAPVPEIPGLLEPGTMVAMGLGIAGLLGAALREKKKDDSGSDSEK